MTTRKRNSVASHPLAITATVMMALALLLLVKGDAHGQAVGHRAPAPAADSANTVSFNREVFQYDPAGRRDAARLALADLVIALLVAVVVNASIVVLAASAFHASGHTEVADLTEAHRLISPLLGASAAGVVFGIALLASGKSSTVTATLTGQIIMEGFLTLRVRPWVRRLITRGVAIVPALVVVAVAGEGAVGKLLILSQAVLSVQLPFAVIPLVRLTSDRAKMGELTSPRWLIACAWMTAAIILGLDGLLLGQLVTGRGA